MVLEFTPQISVLMGARLHEFTLEILRLPFSQSYATKRQLLRHWQEPQGSRDGHIGACEAMDGQARAVMDGTFASPTWASLLPCGGKQYSHKKGPCLHEPLIIAQ